MSSIPITFLLYVLFSMYTFPILTFSDLVLMAFLTLRSCFSLPLCTGTMNFCWQTIYILTLSIVALGPITGGILN